jgi:hypothetical protein
MADNDKYREVKELLADLIKIRERLASEGGDTSAEQEELTEEIQLLSNDLVEASILEDE